MTLDIGFEAIFRGKGFGDDDWKRDANLWSITLTFEGRKHNVEYWMGPGNLDYKRISSASISRRQAEKEGRIKYNHFGPDRDAITSPRAPTRNEVLANLVMDCQIADQLFADFCGDLGYDTDSRKALATYEACQKEMYELRNFFVGHMTEFLSTEWEEIECSSD